MIRRFVTECKANYLKEMKIEQSSKTIKIKLFVVAALFARREQVSIFSFARAFAVKSSAKSSAKKKILPFYNLDFVSFLSLH